MHEVKSSGKHSTDCKACRAKHKAEYDKKYGIEYKKNGAKGAYKKPYRYIKRGNMSTSIITDLKLPKIALTEAINTALMEFTAETGIEITNIDLNAFCKEGRIITYNPKMRILL